MYPYRVFVFKLVVFLVISQSSNAQKLRRFSNTTILSYHFGLADNLPEKRGGMFNLSTSFNYKILPHYGIGIGAGQGNHSFHSSGSSGENYNLFTTFLEGRYFFQDKWQGAELYIHPGYALKIDPAWQKGFVLVLGASYPFSRRKHSNWNLNLSYRYQEIVQYQTGPVKLHGLGFGIGLSFN